MPVSLFYACVDLPLINLMSTDKVQVKNVGMVAVNLIYCC